MKLTKQDIQQRVLRNSKLLDLDDFTWNEETRTFSSNLNGLMLDFRCIGNVTFKTSFGCTFNTGSNCTFDTSYDCTFKTGSNCIFDTSYDCTFKTGYRCIFNTSDNCTFKTGSDCTFKTGSSCIFDTSYNCTFDTDSYCIFDTSYSCTFDTGSYCTFDTSYDCTFKTEYDCVVIRRDEFEVIQLEEDKKHLLNQYNKKGYLKEVDVKMHLNGDASLGEPVIIEDILSKIIFKKENIYKIIDHNNNKESFIVTNGTEWGHCSTIKEAKEEFIHKVSCRDTL